MVSVSDVKVYIINAGEYRDAKPLVSTLSFLGFKQIEVINAVTPEDLPCNQAGKEHMHQGIERELSCREVAVSISHHLIREKIISDQLEWGLVLEDDAVLLEESLIFDTVEALSKQGTKPTLVSLFSEQFGIFYGRKSDFFYKTLKKPDYALAYFINFQACAYLTCCTKFIHLFPADWPRFVPSSMFLATKSSVFVHPIEPDKSIVGADRDRVLGKKLGWRNDIRRKFDRTLFEFSLLLGQRIGKSQINSPQLRSVKIGGLHN